MFGANLEGMNCADWSSIAMTMRYVHMSDDRVLGALASIPAVLDENGDKTGHSRESALELPRPDQALTVRPTTS